MIMQVFFSNNLTFMFNEIDQSIKNLWLNRNRCVGITQFITCGIKLIIIKNINHYCFLKFRSTRSNFGAIVSRVKIRSNIGFDFYVEAR